MAQGKAYTPAQRESILESLRPFLQMGFSRSKSCKLTGMDETTLSKWVKDDEALSMKLQGWENTLNALAISNVASALQKESEIDDTKKETSKWWLERKLKEDGFTTKIEQELSNPDGTLKTIIINKHGGNDRPVTEAD